MSLLNLGQENSRPTQLHYEDLGCGRPVVLVHGWPLASGCWEKQRPALLQAGHRVISYERRGYGRSSRTTVGLDDDTFAEDLHYLLRALDLHDAALVGHATGAVDILRCLGTYGDERVARAVLIAGPPPAPEGPQTWPFGGDLRGMQCAFEADRPALLKRFIDAAVDAGPALDPPVSHSAARALWLRALDDSLGTGSDGLSGWCADLRDDLPRIGVPTLVMHGSRDRICPLEHTGARLAEAVVGSRLIVIDGAPHALLWTHAAQVNGELIAFLAS